MEDKIFLDTNFLIDFLRNKDFAVSFVNEHEKNNRLCVSIISMFELYSGAFKSKNPNNILSVEKLPSRMEIFGLDNETVKEAGRIHVELERKGKTVDSRDILIGATVLINEGVLKTSDVNHFERMEKLKLI